MVLNKLERNKRPYALYAFLWAFILSAFIVVPVMIYDRGYFLYYGDFNVQQIPFYQLAHDSIRSGDTGWSHLTDLGANFIGSYSFYLLGSPFFWLTIWMPSSWVVYSIGPLLMLKLGFASLTSYIYIRRYVRDRKYAVIGGVIYAFCGFSVYNIFFFHFHEAMIFFPLLLAALDEFHAAKRKGVVALAVFACATVNYYFFVGQAVFVLIYYVVKLISKSYRFKPWEFVTLAIECIIGFGMSMFLMLPSIAAITGNSRLGDLIDGWKALIYSNTQRYVQILVSMFFPGDVPAKNNFTPSAGGKWSSVALYIPMFSMTFAILYMRDKKRSFFRRMMIILLIMAFVPVLNSVFQLLNAAYYARWFYMLSLIFTVVTAQSLDRMKEIRFMRGFIPTAIITLSIALLIGLTPEKTETDAHVPYVKVGVETSLIRFWLFVLVAFGGLALTFGLYLIHRKKPKYFFSAAALFLSVFIALYAPMYIWLARSYADRGDSFMIDHALNGSDEITLSDIKEVRSDFYETSDNLGMFWQVPNIQAFHSIVPGSIMDFYNTCGVKRDVGSRPSTEFYGLRGLLSVKYLFKEADDENPPEETSDLMPGYNYIATENGFDIYENQYYIPMGFTYDQFLSKEEFSDMSDNVKHLALLKAMVLSQDQMKKYADITGYEDGMYLNLNFTHNENDLQNAYRPSYEGFDSITADFRYQNEDYYKDAEKLKDNSCSSFTYTKDGFTAEFDNKGDDNLLFFSVPFDEGWSATVNGEPVDIEIVNIGFMAVRVPGDTVSSIEFRYQTPMLKTGCIIAAASGVILIIYIVIYRGFKAKRKNRRTYRIKQNKDTEGII